MGKMKVKEGEDGYLYPFGVNDTSNPFKYGKKGNDLVVVRPKFGHISLYGNLPTDTTDARTPSMLRVKLYDDNYNVLHDGYVNLSIQGSGTVNYDKKSFTYDALDKNEKAIEIKFGNWISCDSFHLKAYVLDSTHARDCGGYRLWRSMIKTLDAPYCNYAIKDFDYPTEIKENELFVQDALFSPDGFPCDVYLNDTFYGLYTMRLKTSRQNYAMDKDNKNEIFLKTTSQTFLSGALNFTDVELKNPKLSGYVEGGEITDSDVLASCQRLFNYTKTGVWEHADDYINVPHWVVWYIFQELVSNYDSCANNYTLFTWDNSHWSIFPYDLDCILGLQLDDKSGQRKYNYVFKKKESFSTNKWWASTETAFWNRFRNAFISEIKSMYTSMRKSGVISHDAVYACFLEQVMYIPRNVISKDRENWSSVWVVPPSGEPYDQPEGAVIIPPEGTELVPTELTMAQIAEFIKNRIDWLDAQWLLND